MDFSIKVFPDFRYLVKPTLYHFQLNRFDRLYLEIERFHHSNFPSHHKEISILQMFLKLKVEILIKDITEKPCNEKTVKNDRRNYCNQLILVLKDTRQNEND